MGLNMANFNSQLTVQDQAALNLLSKSQALDMPILLRHYLSFNSTQQGRAATHILQKDGYKVKLQMGSRNGTWLAEADKVVKQILDELPSLRIYMENIAEKHDGVYDSWEAI